MNIGIVLAVIGITISLPASAGIFDDIKNDFKKKVIKEVEGTLRQPSPPPPSAPSQQPKRNQEYVEPSSTSDVQLCESSANWLSAALPDIQSPTFYKSVYAKAYVGKDVQFSSTSERVRWVHDQYFEPAFGKQYDKLDDSDAARLYTLLTTTSQTKRVQHRLTMENSDCFTIIRNKIPSINDNTVKVAGLLFDQRRRHENISALSEMRNAPEKLAEYQVLLDRFDPSVQSREQLTQIKLDALHWLELSLVVDRNRFVSRIDEIQKFYDNNDLKGRYAAMVATNPVKSGGSTETYTGPKRFSVPTPRKQPDFNSKVPLYSSDKGNLSSMGARGTKDEHFDLAKAGFGVLSCQYGPFRGAEGGFTVEYFWAKQRPVLSPTSIQSAISAGKASDIALPACPPTYGEALAYTYGAKEPPSEAVLAMRQGEARKAGQRFAPTFTTRTDFENTEFSLDGSSLVDDINKVVIPYRVEKNAVPEVIHTEIKRLHASGQRLLQCRYKVKHLMVSESNETVHFWSGNKPASVSEGFSRWVEKLDVPLVDAAATDCPEYLGEAIAMAQGAGTNEALAKAKEAAKRADADPIRPVKVNNEWYVGATANTARRDTQLAKELEQELSSLEGSTGLTWQGFNSSVKTHIAPRLFELARSAYAQVDKIPAGERGHSAFEKWDGLTAGTVMRTIHRLEKIIAKRSAETVAVSDMMKKEAQLAKEQSERNSWRLNANIQFTRPIYYRLLPIYTERFEKQPMLDPAFMAMVDKGLESGAGQAPATTRAPQPTTTVTRRTRIIFGTPAQISAYMIGASIGEGLGKAAAAWGQFTGSIKKLDLDIRNARVKFWNCYAKRCADAPQLYREYSTVLLWKDQHYILRPNLNRKVTQTMNDKTQTMQMGYKIGGAEEVDDGMPVHCSSEQSAVEALVWNALSSWDGSASPSAMSASRSKLDEVFNSNTYATWQQCRDKMEYLDRPRVF